MHLKTHPPIFVPTQFRAEIEQLSKAALMDIVWDYASRCSGLSADDAATGAIMTEFRATRDIVMVHRKQSRVKRG